MARLNLEAKNPAQELILQYLEQNASESLAERINQGNHTLQECFDYIRNEAKKRAVNGVAAIEDRQVYGWAIHYFEENGNPGDVPADDAPTAYNVTGPKPVRIVKEAEAETPLTSGKNGNSGLMFKGSPNLKEIREAKAILEKWEDEATGADIHPEKKQPKKAERVIVPKKPRIPETTKQKKADAEQINGQTSIFDFL